MPRGHSKNFRESIPKIRDDDPNFRDDLSENPVVLKQRLLELSPPVQLIDVGGAGDCFFRSVLHQLYGNSNHHMHIRAAGVQFMGDNSERFIESRFMAE